MLTAELYQIAVEADREFQRLLEARYGRDACNARYDCKRNSATPELARAVRAKHIADKAVHEAFVASRQAAR